MYYASLLKFFCTPSAYHHVVQPFLRNPLNSPTNLLIVSYHIIQVVPITGDLGYREKTLLTLLGSDPGIPNRYLLEVTGYRCGTTISKKKKELKEMGYLRGPYYSINLNAVGQNELFDIYTDIAFDTSNYNLVHELIQAIGCWRWIFPAIQGDRFFVYFQCNYHTQIARLLNLLKKEGIIEYTFYSSQNRWIVENPDFFGKEILSYENLSATCELPDLKYPPEKVDKPCRRLDIRMMAYLQVQSLDMKYFRACEKDYGYTWRKNQIKYSIQKLIKHAIAERKHYNIAPYPRDTCFSFLLLVKGKNPFQALKIMRNLGKNCRVYKTYTLTGIMGIMLCWANAKNIPNFLSAFEDANDVWVKAYQLKAHNTPYMMKQSFDVENFDLETQRWIFPYQEYQTNIEQILEKRDYD